MSETTEEFTPFEFKLGKAPAQRPAMGCLHTYFDGHTLPVAPVKCTYAMKVLYPLALNGTYGDCVVAGWVHLAQAVAQEIGDTYSYPGDPAVKATYFNLTGGADTGLVESTFLQKASQAPILESQVEAFAPIDHTDLAEVKSTIYTFGGVFLGVDLPQSAEHQFPGNWTVVPGSPIIGGHCVIGIGYDEEGIYLVTWGAIIHATWAWFSTYCDEAYAVLTSDQVAKGHGPLKQLDIARLKADIAAL